MATLNIPNSFTNGYVANANEVNANFQNVKTFAETQVVSIDGAVQAGTAAIANNAITTAKIANDAVTSDKIAVNAVGSSEIADGSVGTAELANDAVTADKVADGATLPVNITGNAVTATNAINASYATSAGYATNAGSATNATNAGYATNAGSANTANTASSAISATSATSAGSLSAGGLSLFQTSTWWYTEAEFDFGGPIYYISPGPSSVTEGIVRTSTGELKKNSASGVSLRDYKEDIVPMENALAQLSLLKPRNFRFKEEILVPNEPYDVFNRRTQLQYGFVMEEVQESVPDLVMHKSSDGTNHEAMYWKEPGMIALAIGAIQELSAKVDSLEARLAELESK